MQYTQQAAAVTAEVNKAVQGKQQTVNTIWMAMLAGGHVLIEDIPGVGKTTLALAFARALDLKESRVQFTPDVLPADITGFTVYNREKDGFFYRPGAVMCNILLADEINRATPRTQSALLEAMETGKVSGYMTDFPSEDILGRPGIVCTPHLGASTPEAEDNCAIMAAQELSDYLLSLIHI